MESIAPMRERLLRAFRAAVPADDAAAEARRAQSQAHRCAQQARAQNGDALDHGSFLVPALQRS